MKHILSLAVLLGAVLAQGCLLSSDNAKASQLHASNQTLQRELDAARAQADQSIAKAAALEQELSAARQELGVANTRVAELVVEKERAEVENLRLSKQVARLDPSKPAKLWSRTELERALAGLSRDEVKKVLGAPSTSSGSAGTFWKYSRVCYNTATGKVDEYVQLNFDSNVVRSFVY
jgi:outer membrane protein assembly factor BamE (lipoprotein component of BamABCDE complex)